MTASQWLGRDPVMNQGELGFETDTDRAKIGDGTTKWTGLPYMDAQTTSSTRTRLEYGTLRLTEATKTSVTQLGFSGIVVKQHPDLMGLNFDRYRRCSWDIYEIGGNSWSGLSFSTESALYAFLAANAAQTGGYYSRNIMATVYDTVDATIPVVNKMWGINTFYSMLKGRKRYNDNRQTLGRDLINWPQFEDWFQAVCSRGLGLPAGAYAVNRERALWLTRSNRTRYGMPTEGITLNSLSTTGDRMVYNSATATWVPMSGGDFQHWEAPPTGYGKVFATICENNRAAWEFETAYTGIVRSLLAYGASSMSMICLYRLHGISGGNSTHNAILVKPVGIDRVGINWYDPAQYTLYALHECPNETPRIRPITGIPAKHISQGNDLIWLNKSVWTPFEDGRKPTVTSRMKSRLFPTTRFFLRDNATHRISIPSQMCVKMTLNAKDAMVKWGIFPAGR